MPAFKRARLKFQPNPGELYPTFWDDAVTLYATRAGTLTMERVGPVVGTGILHEDGFLHVDLISDADGRPPLDPLCVARGIQRG